MVGLFFVLQVSYLSIIKLLLSIAEFSLDLANDSIYIYFIDNQRTSGHQSLIFGLRELNSTEMSDYCLNQSMNNIPPIPDKPFHFSSNYQLRSFTSGCYYFDSNDNWQSDGLMVSFSLSL
jgi:hypothetical protein